MKVLIVEDFPDTAPTLSALMAHCGHEPRVAVDGNEALTTAAAWTPDVILMDIGLPGMDGYMTAHRIRKDHEFKGKIFMVSAYQPDEARQSHAGADGHCMKPYTVQSIQSLIAS